MKKVTGIGGIFYKVKDQEAHKAWYKEHLGIESDQYGGKFAWRNDEDPNQRGLTAWSPFPSDTGYFKPSAQDFMINYRVDDLEALMKELKKAGVEIVGEMESFDYGKFAWIMDPDGYKVELWEAIDKPLLDE
jgi:predicted enzyme related to lactoylglutathione lyase